MDKYTVLNPQGHRAPIQRTPLAPRIDSLDGKTIYIVDMRWPYTEQFTKELQDILDWSKTNVTSTLHICWGAQAGLYYHYGIEKIKLPEKKFGVFEHLVKEKKERLVRGFDEVYYVPHSRHTDINTEPSTGSCCFVAS